MKNRFLRTSALILSLGLLFNQFSPATATNTCGVAMLSGFMACKTQAKECTAKDIKLCNDACDKAASAGFETCIGVK